MTSALSLYLDALRFTAAFTVFLSHFAVGRLSGALFWQVAAYGRTAVLVFFVLSGFVIAWVSETREHSLEEYAVSRIARLYSVILPAFVLTAALNRLGSDIDPSLYSPEWDHATAHPVVGFLLSGLFLGESWTLAMLPGRNIPFWSLNYEAWYYVLFGAATFLRGRRRILAVGAAGLVAGPKILLLLPIWLMGVAAWRWRAGVPRQLGTTVVAVSLAGLILLESLGGQQLFWHPGTYWLPPGYSAYDYLLGVLVALLIMGLANSPLPLPGGKSERLIRWLAGSSFGLYLLHFPILNLCAAVVPGPADGPMHRVLVFSLALGTAVALGHLLEQRKGLLRRALRFGFDAVLGRRPPALERPRTEVS